MNAKWPNISTSAAAWLAAAGLVVGVLLSALLVTRVPVLRIVGFLLPLIVMSVPLFVILTRRAAAYDAGLAAEKPKRGESLGDLLSLLNEDDIEDLRTRVKTRLDEQIDDGDPDELEALYDLLDQQDKQNLA